MATHHRVRAGAVLCGLGLAALGLSACQEAGPTRPVAPSRAESAAEAGGSAALIKAAKRGRLNTIALPRKWANYGELIDGFEKKYGIKVVIDHPNDHSQQEIEAMKRYRGQQRAPDVLDIGDSFAQSAARQNLLAPYRVAPFDQIPPEQKDAKARWYNNYGGYVSIGCDAARVRTCPDSFADLLRPEYKGLVSMYGQPTSAGSSFAAVYAAALANGGRSTTSSRASTSSPGSTRSATTTEPPPTRPRSPRAGHRSASNGTTSTWRTSTNSAGRA